MDILTGGLIGLGVYAAYLISCKIGDVIYPIFAKNFTTIDYSPYILANNGLSDYKIVVNNEIECGREIVLEVPALGSYQKFSDVIPILEKQFKGKIFLDDVPFSEMISMKIITKNIDDLDYKPIELSPYQLLCGYDYKGDPLIADMKVASHLIVTGLSGNGKTGMLRIMTKNIIENNNADVMLLNGFIDDYEDLNINHIRNHEDIKNFIQSLLDDIENEIKRDKPLYILFEELGKVKDKELTELTTKLLQYGRHNSIYLIGVIQTATKEELKFKNLFNARLSFKQVEESSYRVVLGVAIEEKLKKREFYLFTDNLYKGKTYNLKW